MGRLPFFCRFVRFSPVRSVRFGTISDILEENDKKREQKRQASVFPAEFFDACLDLYRVSGFLESTDKLLFSGPGGAAYVLR
jgi:hypothetical protein